jgi:hypothetical protein
MSSPRKVLIALSLLLAVSPGCVSQEPDRSTDNPCASAGNQIIDVDGNGHPGCVDAKISKKKKHRVVWQSPDDTNLQVVFRASPSPLKVHCKNNTCKSEPVDKDVAEGPYEYQTKVTAAAVAGASPEPSPATSAVPTRTPTQSPGPYARIIIQK